MKKIIIFTAMIGVAIEAPIRWLRVSNPWLGVPGWGWARPLTVVFLAITAAAMVSTLGGWILARWSKTPDEAEAGLVFEGVSNALFALEIVTGVPTLIWWGLYLA